MAEPNSFAPRNDGDVVRLVSDSPLSWMFLQDRAQAPTWNYTSAQFVAEIRLMDDAAFLDAHLRDLTEALEQTTEDPWHIDELGARREILAARIVAIEAAIVSAAGRFKLGQDENDRTYREISGALQDAGKEDLLSWMLRYNRSRD